jgi:hypothetical protein
MKNKFLLSAIGFLFLFACKKADDNVGTTDQQITVIPQSSVPTAVLNSFNSSFSGATEVEWHKSSNLFESEFHHSNQRHLASFDDNGNKKSHSISCSSGPVPAVVLAAFRATHPNDNVYEWKLRSDGNWKAHFMRGTVKWETTYTAAGVFVKEEHY